MTRRAFTLIEVLLASVITAAVLAAVMPVAMRLTGSAVRAEERLAALDWLQRAAGDPSMAMPGAERNGSSWQAGWRLERLPLPGPARQDGPPRRYELWRILLDDRRLAEMPMLILPDADPDSGP